MLYNSSLGGVFYSSDCDNVDVETSTEVSDEV